MTANVTKMAYTGETPWHGEGTPLTQGADVDTWIREAGLGYEVKKAAVHYNVDDKSRTFSDRFVTYHGETGNALGLVSDRYKIFQPRNAVEFYRDFVEANRMKLETAGTLLNARRVWGLASLEEATFTLPGGDAIRPYFLLMSSYDGETSTIGTYTATRVVCCNTLAMALGAFKDDQRKAKGSSGFSISHSKDFDIKWARQQASNLLEASQEFKAKAELLASAGIGGDDLLAYFIGLVGVENEKHELTPQSKAKVDKLVQLYKSGPGADLPTSRGTLWGALNAVTRFVDHEAPVRSAGSRFASGQFGPGAQLKNKALELALELAVAA